MAKQIGCVTKPTPIQRVMVANGEKMACSVRNRRFAWEMQGQAFEANVLLMPSKGFELILGIEWLKSLRMVK